ncbi:hypothetical protein EV368DRAFT_69961 [Lentinula lateritia]|nr:hypothetical protein EV368DRAFT_69961 [Lentinula lateritia]
MEPNTQSVRKCIHQKFLPIGEHPAQEGVLEPSCGHITPLYNFGWCLPMEEIDQYYPECEWDMANYWPKHVRVPWAKEFRNKYLSKEQPGFGYSPYLDFFFLKKKPKHRARSSFGTTRRLVSLVIWVMSFILSSQRNPQLTSRVPANDYNEKKNRSKESDGGVDKSILSKYAMNSFWTWFVTLFPLSIAPNTITCITIFNFFHASALQPELYDGKRRGLCSPINIFHDRWSIGLLLYQGFDAADGKQARKNGMAGPLGEIFDHSRDAMSTTELKLEVVLVSRALTFRPFVVDIRFPSSYVSQFPSDDVGGVSYRCPLTPAPTAFEYDDVPPGEGVMGTDAEDERTRAVSAIRIRKSPTYAICWLFDNKPFVCCICDSGVIALRSSSATRSSLSA